MCQVQIVSSLVVPLIPLVSTKQMRKVFHIFMCSLFFFFARELSKITSKSKKKSNAMKGSIFMSFPLKSPKEQKKFV